MKDYQFLMLFALSFAILGKVPPVERQYTTYACVFMAMGIASLVLPALAAFRKKKEDPNEWNSI